MLGSSVHGQCSVLSNGHSYTFLFVLYLLLPVIWWIKIIIIIIDVIKWCPTSSHHLAATCTSHLYNAPAAGSRPLNRATTTPVADRQL